MVRLLMAQFSAGVRNIYEVQLVSMRHDEQVIGAVIRSVIFKQKADLIISVGEVCGIVVKSIIDDLVNSIPVIFVGVREEQARVIFGPLEDLKGNITGVVRASLLLPKQTGSIAGLYPIIKLLLLPYSKDLLNCSIELQTYLVDIGIKVILLPVTADNNATLSKIIHYLPTVDGVMLLEGCYTNGIQPEIAYWCWWHEVVLIGSGPHAISNGAACSFGGDLTLIAQAAYEKTRLLWERKILVKDIPVTVLPNNEQFFVNIDMMRRLDVPVQEIVRICMQTKAQVVRRWTKPFKLD
jgi:ABC-type uncharacterized transport system substrate-binding protein